MTPPRDQILYGDCRQTLSDFLAAGAKVQMCVTSPPYYGLRDYGTATWEGGDPGCTHELHSVSDPKNPGKPSQNGRPAKEERINRRRCRCGAVRKDQQIGLETTPEEYVAELVGIFQQVYDLVSDDGTLWLNIGDSYASTGGTPSEQRGELFADRARGQAAICKSKRMPRGEGRWGGGNGSVPHLYPKEMIGVPWRLAYAMQGFAVVPCASLGQWADLLAQARAMNDWEAVAMVEQRLRAAAMLDALREAGWYLRQDIIWRKPAPMPESVLDRCTRSHEYLFLLSKSPRYYFNAEAIAEPLARPKEGLNKKPAKFGGADKFEAASHQSRLHSGNEYKGKPSGTRNRRSVWTIGFEPCKFAHFAVFPSKLAELCILAGSRPGDTVLDPFMGSGTVAEVALRNERHYLGCELNPEYKEIQDKRIASAVRLRRALTHATSPKPVENQPGLFDQVAASP